MLGTCSYPSVHLFPADMLYTLVKGRSGGTTYLCLQGAVCRRGNGLETPGSNRKTFFIQLAKYHSKHDPQAAVMMR